MIEKEKFLNVKQDSRKVFFLILMNNLSESLGENILSSVTTFLNILLLRMFEE